MMIFALLPCKFGSSGEHFANDKTFVWRFSLFNNAVAKKSLGRPLSRHIGFPVMIMSRSVVIIYGCQCNGHLTEGFLVDPFVAQAGIPGGRVGLLSLLSCLRTQRVAQ